MIIPTEQDRNDDGTQATEVICDYCSDFADYKQRGEQGHLYHLCDECYWRMFENYNEDAPVSSEWEFQHENQIEPL